MIKRVMIILCLSLSFQWSWAQLCDFSESSSPIHGNAIKTYVNADGSLFQNLSKGGFYAPFDSRALRLFPNPNQGHFNIELPNEEVHQLQIFDALGQMVYQKQLVKSILG